MRKELLGLLTCLASGSLALGQYAGEPVPIQGPGYSAGPGAYSSPFPSYAPPPAMPGGSPYPAYAPQQPMMPSYPPMPPYAAGPGYPPASQPLPGYPMGGFPVRPGMMLPPNQNGAPGTLTSNAPPVPPTPPNPFLPPAGPVAPRDVLPPPPATGAKTKALPDSGPTEPYLCAVPEAQGPSEPYFQQIDPWKPVRPARSWTSLDYLAWWTKQQNVPPVGTLPGIDLVQQANFANDPRSGFRVTYDAWITTNKDLAAEASYFFLGEQLLRSNTPLPGSAPSPATLPAFFGINSQSSQLTLTSNLWGAEANLRYQMISCKADCVYAYLDLLGGFRYVDLSEALTDQTSTQFAKAPVTLSNGNLSTVDNFFTHNNFYGAQLGAAASVYYWRFNVSTYGKVALGDNTQTANISGYSTITGAPPPFAAKTVAGGILAQPSNSGYHVSNVFAAVPEAGINVAFRVFDFCQLGVGYSFLYMSRVVRPGDQVTPVTTGTLPASLGGTASAPAFSFQESHFWAQGLNLRLMFTF